MKKTIFFVLIFITQLINAHESVKPINLSEEHASMLDDASFDIYQPPNESQLTTEQIELFISVSNDAKTLYEKLKTEYLDTHAENNVHLCKTFVPKLASVIATKSKNYNWAEYDWINRQLRLTKYLSKINTVDMDVFTRQNINNYLKYKTDIENIFGYCNV